MMNDITIKLEGASNFIDWHRSFELAAKDNDVWNLLTGEFKPVTTEPDMHADEYQPHDISIETTANTLYVGKGREVNLAKATLHYTPAIKVKMDNKEKPTDKQKPDIDLNYTVFLHHDAAFSRFEFDRLKWKISMEKIRAARKLIRESVTWIVERLIKDKLDEDPVEAYKLLLDTYKPSDEDTRRVIHEELSALKLEHFDMSVQAYVSRVLKFRDSLQKHGEWTPVLDVAGFILHGLPDAFREFKERQTVALRLKHGSNMVAYGRGGKNKPDGQVLDLLISELDMEVASREKRLWGVIGEKPSRK